MKKSLTGKRRNTSLKNNYIYTHIRKSSILGIIVALLVLTVIMTIFILLPFREVLSPKEISLIHQISYAYSNDVEYIEITLNDIHYTGYDSYRQGKLYASYYYSLYNNALGMLKNSGSHLMEMEEVHPRQVNQWIMVRIMVYLQQP